MPRGILEYVIGKKKYLVHMNQAREVDRIPEDEKERKDAFVKKVAYSVVDADAEAPKPFGEERPKAEQGLVSTVKLGG